MPTDLYQPFTHPITGETFKCLSFTQDCYKMQWLLKPKGYVAMEHIHYFQDERFYVKTGRLNVIIDGKRNILNPGDSIVVTKGLRHIAENYDNSDVECEVDYTPGLDYFVFMQCFIGLLKDKQYDVKGSVNIPKMAFCMYKTKCTALARPTSVPKPLFKFILPLFGAIGSVLGWDRLLKNYVGDINN